MIYQITLLDQEKVIILGKKRSINLNDESYKPLWLRNSRKVISQITKQNNEYVVYVPAKKIKINREFILQTGKKRMVMKVIRRNNNEVEFKIKKEIK